MFIFYVYIYFSCINIHMYVYEYIHMYMNINIFIGDTFKGMNNITVVTSNGLVYSWGANLIPRPHVAYKSKTHSRDEGLND